MEFLIGPIIELFAYLFSAVSWDHGNPVEATDRPEKKTAAIAATDLRTRDSCAFCRSPVGPFVACRKCRAPHHADCARLNRRCAVFGCGTREFRARAA